MKNSYWQPDFEELRGREEARAGAAVYPDKDYTPEILAFLRSVHGKIRRDDRGDYYYDSVCTISLHFLLNSRLPPKDTLWSWYDYFDRERSESIYQTLPPLKDEAFLRILDGCSFRWDAEAVRNSGLIFLSRHRKEVYSALEGFLAQRLEAHRGMSDDELRVFLTPKHTWSDSHLRRQVRRLQIRPLDADQRRGVYERFQSDYVRATARHIMDQSATEAFWKRPPPELEGLRARFKVLVETLAEEARRQGVYVTREAYVQSGWRQGREGARRSRRKGYNGRRAGRLWPDGKADAYQFAMLGLTPAATLAEVKVAYRDRVKQYHPDQGGPVDEFIRLQEAYEFLLTEVF